MAEYETDFDLTNCGYGLQYAKSKFILAKKIFHLYIYIYIYNENNSYDSANSSLYLGLDIAVPR